MSDEQPTQHLPTLDVPEPAPSPKPTLASLIVARLQEAAQWIERLDVNMDMQRAALRETRVLALAALGVALLSVLLNIALLVLVSVLVGHVR